MAKLFKDCKDKHCNDCPVITCDANRDVKRQQEGLKNKTKKVAPVIQNDYIKRHMKS